MVFDMFMWPASLSGLRLFRNRSLHSSIRNFLLLCDSAVVFRLVWGMRAGRGSMRQKTGNRAKGLPRKTVKPLV